MKRPPSRLRLVADAGEPLLGFVVRRGGISEQLAREAIERGGAFVGGRRVREVERPLHPGERVEVALPRQPAPALQRSQLIHLDELLLAVDKPAGVAAQEDLAGTESLPALCTALLGALGEKQTQALLVHRLDRGTTGVTLLARTRRTQAFLLGEFRARRVKKEYRALVAGAPLADEGAVESAVESRPALTRWRVVARYQSAAEIAAWPETGRTHQIRIHLRELGCPLLGDKTYGGPVFFTRADGRRHDFTRPMLHAVSLELRHPAGHDLRLRAASPVDYEEARAFLER
ncbi:MAG TPA: RluA family pseudouridine synthase [Myxococcales bacterium]|nr:RluA family pseudouridine synthase [Myxococcales bacterium]